MSKRCYRRFCLLALVAIASCSDADKTSTVQQAELLSRIKDQSAPVILDVRSEAEFQSGHVPGAINLPYPDHLPALNGLKLKKSQEIVVYCETGGRAEKVESLMKDMGFFELRHLNGDMRGWREAGLPSE